MTTATWKITEPQLGMQAIDATDTTQNHGLGKIVRASNSTQGDGEFIYLLGVANTVVGSLVTYNATTYQTALSPTTGATTRPQPVAVAMSANVASQYGWYQIEGLAVIKKTAVAFSPQVAVYLSATTGRIKAIQSAGMQILGAMTANLATVVTSTSTVTVLINRPHLQGQIT